MIYLLCRKWNGAINIASMRYFGDYDSLYHHVQEHDPEYWDGGEPYHVYKVYDDGSDATPLTPKQNRALGLRPSRRK